jgi:hypothetical protein
MRGILVCLVLGGCAAYEASKVRYNEDPCDSVESRCRAASFAKDPVAVCRCKQKLAQCRNEPPRRCKYTETICREERDRSTRCYSVEHDD